MAAVRQFIAESGYSEALRARMQGDASTRSYERLALGDKHVILMNSPRRPDGPPVRDGKPYSAIAHLAESVVPFVAMANGLAAPASRRPTIYHADLEQGLLIIEDLGDERVVAGDPPAPIAERYETAVDALLALHAQQLPDVLPVAPHVEYRIPLYDMDAFLIEAELLLDWYLPRLAGPGARTSARDVPGALARGAAAGDRCAADLGAARLPFAQSALAAERAATSPASACSISRTPLMGPAAYDLASLLQDARVDVPEQIELALLGRYVRGRRQADADFDRTAVHQDLRHARRPARQQDPRHLRPARPARRQAAIFASHAADMGLSAALARPSGAGAAQRVV